MFEDKAEKLREELLDEVYAGAFSGMGAMILDAREIRDADAETLKTIARRMGKEQTNLGGDVL